MFIPDPDSDILPIPDPQHWSTHVFLFSPAFNCTSTSTINAVLEAARSVNSPVIIQFSNGGAAFLAGKGIKNTKEKAAILGAIAGAQHVRLMAKHYNVPVVLHSDHCAKKLLPWFDGMLEADEEYFKVQKIPYRTCSFSAKICKVPGTEDIC